MMGMEGMVLKGVMEWWNIGVVGRCFSNVGRVCPQRAVDVPTAVKRKVTELIAAR
jgi:hypothetical protein